MLFTLSSIIFFFFTDTATTEIYTLSLHDALPISWNQGSGWRGISPPIRARPWRPRRRSRAGRRWAEGQRRRRSEEHTSELQSPYDLVCRLLLEKKKKKKNQR